MPRKAKVEKPKSYKTLTRPAVRKSRQEFPYQMMVRLSESQAKWIEERMAKTDKSATAVMREVLDVVRKSLQAGAPTNA